MNANDRIRPAWQTDDLAEEWIEEGEQDDLGSNGQQDRHLRISSKQASIKDIKESTGSSTKTKRLSTDDDTKSAGPGTFVIREDIQAVPILPQTPGKKTIIKDFFSPLALEKLFEPPSPPQRSPGQVSVSPSPVLAAQQRRMGPAKPSKLSQVVSQSFFEEEKEEADEEDEIVETDMPNMIAFGGHKLSTKCQFTFTVSQKNNSGHENHLYPGSQPQAESTPLPQFGTEKQLSPGSHPKAQSTPLPPHTDKNMRPSTDPRLRLFQFQYDTYTREHLSAIVDSIGVNSPSSEGSTGGPIDLQQATNIEQQHDISYAHLRSTKRIKLSPTDERSLKDRIEGRKLLRPKNKKDYVGESKSLMQQIKMQARDVSLLSVVDQAAAITPHREERETKDELTHNAPQSNAQQMFLKLPEMNVPRPASAASTFASGGSKTNSYSSVSYRQQAADLMAQIKSDMRGSRRLFSDQTEHSSVEEHRHHRKTSSKTKFSNGTIYQQVTSDSVSDEPQKSIAKGVTLVDNVGTGEHDNVNEKENRQPPSNHQIHSHLEQQQHKLPSMKPKLFSSKPQNSIVDAELKDDAGPATVLGKSRGGAANGLIGIPPIDSVEKRQKASDTATATTVLTEVSNTTSNATDTGGSSSSRVFHRHSPNPTYLAPSTGRGASIRARNNPGGNDVNDNQQNHPHVTNANEDLNRFVSSSTTATTATGTTLTTGSFVKHPGPAHMVHIAPNDVPDLPERVGKMIFDRDVMRWVKVKDVDVWAVHDVALGYNGRKGGVVGREGEEESEDPFRDIESLRDEEDSTKQEQDMSEAANKNDEQDDFSVEMSLENDTDDESDEEEKDLVTFSFDGPPSGVVEVMTGDDSMDTDSVDDDDNDDLEADEVYEEVDSIIDAPDDNLSTMTTSMSLASPHKSLQTFRYPSPTRPSIPTSSSAPVVVLSTPRATYNNVVPGSSNRAPPQPRSVLKNTPNSMSFTRHQVAQNGNTPVRTGSNSVHRRSVSFSDGRKDGKIIGLDIGRRNVGSSSMITPSNSGGTVNSDGNYTNTPTPVGMSTHPSIRTNRITELLEEIEEPLSADKGDRDHRSQVDNGNDNNESPTRPLPPSQILMSPNKRRALNASATGSNRGGRSPLTRSRTYRGTATSSSQQQQQQQAFSTHPSNITNITQNTTTNNQTFLTECSFAITHDKLVRLLTDVSPFEPYWHTLRTLDFEGRKVDSVARLKEFMPRLDSVNLNDNLLTYLSGIPSSVRSLSVASNALTSLTSYAHLRRLECLDISKNDIDSLRPLGVLKHLRELRADDNRITSLGGIEALDGLMKLSLKGNEVSGDVDLGGVQWQHLEMLDLSYNRIERISGLGVLTSLIAINLDNNLLTSITLPVSPSPSETPVPASHVQSQRTLSTLRILRLSCNRLTGVDMGMFPGVKTVYVDENKLAGKDKRGLMNLSKTRKLENLSARSQSGGGTLQLDGKDIRDIKRLYLSGNPTPLPSLRSESTACFHLTYLELAGCRLTTLPAGLSAHMPNVRALNVNYNFLSSEEIGRGIEGMRRLKKLSAVGCRMQGLKSVVKALRGCKEIEMIDFRMNPCTLEWYVPLLVPLTSRTGKEDEWESMDKEYRRSLPDKIYAGRMAYRGIVMGACDRVEWMDGVRVGQREREKAGRVIRRVMENNK